MRFPRFAPECFAHIYSSNSATHKRFREGLDQLLREGVAQAFKLKDPLVRIPLLGAVGPLQFDVLQYRLESLEYGAECRIQIDTLDSRAVDSLPDSDRRERLISPCRRVRRRLRMPTDSLVRPPEQCVGPPFSGRQ